MIARAIASFILVWMVLANIQPVAAQEDSFDCDTLGTPTAEVATGSVVSSPADFDYAFLILQGVLANAAGQLALLAATDLKHPELADFASGAIANAESDQTQLQNWANDLFPAATPELNGLIATVESAKMKLDLPAGEGGLEAFGAVVGIGLICTSEGPYDEIYLASSIDLSQQQIDLAQVAVINAANSDVVAFATAVIERETAAIGQLVTWQNLWLTNTGTPAS